MSIHTHAPMTFRRILLVSISACVACSIISWCASKWVYDKPIGMMYSSNPYVVAAVTAMVIFANQYLIKKLWSWNRRLQRLEAQMLAPVTAEYRSSCDRPSAAHRGRSALYGSPKGSGKSSNGGE